jgi:flagellar biosynthesis/type III secretory pathway chaperone
MNDKLDRLVDALRHELQQYGEMLALFEQQQEHLIRRNAPEVLNSVTLINAQSGAIQEARRCRVERLQDLAESLSVPPDGTIATLLPALPESRRPQVGALMDENNRLLSRIQQRARQNHLMLSHSLEHMTRFLNTILGASPVRTYDGGGTLAGSKVAAHAIYEAVG